MVSCEDDFELTKFFFYLANIYGTKLSMHTGRKHDYLGVDMEFCEDGALEVSMFKYLNNVIEGFPRDHMRNCDELPTAIVTLLPLVLLLASLENKVFQYGIYH